MRREIEGWHELAPAARLAWLWLGSHKKALLRLWPEALARELGLGLEECLAGLKQLQERGLCFYERDYPLIWLPGFPLPRRGLDKFPSCPLLKEALAGALPRVRGDACEENIRERILDLDERIRCALFINGEAGKAGNGRGPVNEDAKGEMRGSSLLEAQARLQDGLNGGGKAAASLEGALALHDEGEGGPAGYFQEAAAHDAAASAEAAKAFLAKGEMRGSPELKADGDKAFLDRRETDIAGGRLMTLSVTAPKAASQAAASSNLSKDFSFNLQGEEAAGRDKAFQGEAAIKADKAFQDRAGAGARSVQGDLASQGNEVFQEAAGGEARAVLQAIRATGNDGAWAAAGKLAYEGMEARTASSNLSQDFSFEHHGQKRMESRAAGKEALADGDKSLSAEATGGDKRGQEAAGSGRGDRVKCEGLEPGISAGQAREGQRSRLAEIDGSANDGTAALQMPGNETAAARLECLLIKILNILDYARAEEEIKILINKLNSSSSTRPLPGLDMNLIKALADLLAPYLPNALAGASSSSSPSSPHEAAAGASYGRSAPQRAYAAPESELARSAESGAQERAQERHEGLRREGCQDAEFAPEGERRKAGNEGGKAVNKGACGSCAEALASAACRKEEDFKPWRRDGRPFPFLNCAGEEEYISAELVDYWRMAFPLLDMDLELSGIAVWLKGHYADERQGGPMPGRDYMENYIANCLRAAARRAEKKGKKRAARARRPEKPMAEEELDKIIFGILEERGL